MYPAMCLLFASLASADGAVSRKRCCRLFRSSVGSKRLKCMPTSSSAPSTSPV
eukprot:CAMPEP_0119422960 /NCGR_PEP_ID=MMETSP1335-20130426/29276_1 /TAXON_ID=259385 /ORGANISM="Chrysoculter rhomboideus, Strain RCC1486" /LENGTH=52 /DNA_ID=CAMNT_0007448433 /DNA_START=156 /DNA_END=311 /DNA_ORIENTATION=+